MAELPPASPSPYIIGLPHAAVTRTFDPGIDPVGDPRFAPRVRVYPSGQDPDVPLPREVRGSQLRWLPLECTGQEPVARFAHAMATCRGRVYIFGGMDEDGVPVDDLDVVDLNMAAEGARGSSFTAVFSRPPPRGERPRGRWGHTLCALGPRLYVFGGTNGRELYNDVYVYDVEMRAWLKPQVAAPAGAPEPRMGHAAAIVRPKGAPRAAGAAPPSVPLNAPAPLPPAPSAAPSLAPAVSWNKAAPSAPLTGASLVVLGGVNRGGQPILDAWALDIGEELAWRRLEIDGLDRWSHQLQGSVAATTDGELVFLSGGGCPVTTFSPMSASFLELRPPLSAFMVGTATVSDPPAGRAMHSASAVGHRLAVFGGRSTDILGDLHVLDTPTMEWHEPPAAGREFAPPPLFLHASAAVGDKLLLFGGVTWAPGEEGSAIFVNGDAFALASVAGGHLGPPRPPAPGHLSSEVAGYVSDALELVHSDPPGAALLSPGPGRRAGPRDMLSGIHPSLAGGAGSLLDIMRIFLPYPPFSSGDGPGAGVAMGKSVKKHLHGPDGEESSKAASSSAKPPSRTNLAPSPVPAASPVPAPAVAPDTQP